MAQANAYPAFISVEFDKNSGGFRDFRLGAIEAGAEVKRQFERDMGDVQSIVKRALTLPAGASGGLNIDTSSMRQAAAQADVTARATREVARAMEEAARSADDNSAATRRNIQAAQAAAREAQQEATALGTKAAAYERVQTELNRTGTQITAYWSALDDYRDERDNRRAELDAAKDSGGDAPADIAPFEHPETAAIADLIDRLYRRSERLRRMDTDNAKYQGALPRYAIAHCVTGWTGLETPPRFEDELLTVGSVYDLEEELEDRFGTIGKAAVAELATAAIGRLFLSKEAEKNSESGPASQQTPGATKATVSGKPNGASPESETSPETLAE